ncbi:MAG: hypothetical protein K2X87_21980 [Gemmataceae bacterium]|nr:hypothetical protein [Gemmataceae bacterium]
MSVAHAGKAAAVLTKFRPRDHGFPFANSFPAGQPVFVVRVSPFRIPVGDASKGLCGGMVFAALDHLRYELLPPGDPNADGLHGYLARRLWASFNLPWTVLRLYQWMGRPDAARVGRGYYPEATVPYLTARREWPKVRAALDRGDPAPLMLVKSRSRNPWDLGHNHQVLAVGYEEYPDAGDVTVYLYEPNYPLCNPGDEDVTLRFNTREYDGRAVEHSREGPSVRGFFLNRYTPAEPPAWG